MVGAWVCKLAVEHRRQNQPRSGRSYHCDLVESDAEMGRLASKVEEPAPMLRGRPWGQGQPFRCPEDADLKTHMEMREALMSGHGMCIAYLPQDWSICDPIIS